MRKLAVQTGLCLFSKCLLGETFRSNITTTADPLNQPQPQTNAKKLT